MEAVEADMAVAEEAAADSEDNGAVAEDSVEAAAVPLAAVVEADQCAAAAWAEAVVDHSPTENSFRIESQMALSPLIYVNPRRKPTKFSQLHCNAYK